jgi:hypothetical protein
VQSAASAPLSNSTPQSVGRTAPPSAANHHVIYVVASQGHEDALWHYLQAKGSDLLLLKQVEIVIAGTEDEESYLKWRISVAKDIADAAGLPSPWIIDLRAPAQIDI